MASSSERCRKWVAVANYFPNEGHGRALPVDPFLAKTIGRSILFRLFAAKQMLIARHLFHPRLCITNVRHRGMLRR